MVALTKIPAYTFGMIPACRQIRISSGFELWHGVSVISDSRHSYETPTVSAPLQDTTLGTMPAAKASLVSAGSSYPLSATDSSMFTPYSSLTFEDTWSEDRDPPGYLSSRSRRSDGFPHQLRSRCCNIRKKLFHQTGSWGQSRTTGILRSFHMSL